MGGNGLPLRRVLPLTSSLLSRCRPSSSLHPLPLQPALASTILNHLNSGLGFLQQNPIFRFPCREYRSSLMLFSRRLLPTIMDNGGIDPKEILFEGCDFNHWLITMEFPQDPKPSPEEMVEAYVQTAAEVLGSVEVAKRKIYACSTTTYHGFQVEVSQEVSEKFRGLPGVVFILPDSYIDPVNKEYGGDKYINGQIIHRPPPVQYGRQGGRFGDRNREFDRPSRGQRQQNYGRPLGRDPTLMNNASGVVGTDNGSLRAEMHSFEGLYNLGERRNDPSPRPQDFVNHGNRGNYGPRSTDYEHVAEGKCSVGNNGQGDVRRHAIGVRGAHGRKIGSSYAKEVSVSEVS